MHCAFQDPEELSRAPNIHLVTRVPLPLDSDMFEGPGNRTPQRNRVSEALKVKWRKGYALIPSMLTLLVSHNVLRNKFAYDDIWMIVSSSFIHNSRNIFRIFTVNAWAAADPAGLVAFPYFRPVIAGFLIICYRLFGTTPVGYHFASLLLHATVTLLVFLVLRKVSGRRWTALLATLLFAVHPVHVESVAWISGVTDPLMAVFALLAFYLYLRYREGGGTYYIVLSLFTYFLAINSKETAIILPLLTVCWELWHSKDTSLKQRINRALIQGSLFAIPTAVYLYTRYQVNGSLLFTDKPYFTVGDTLRIIPTAMMKYLRLMVVPEGYKIQHYTVPPESLLNGALIGLVLLIIAVVLAIRFVKSRPLHFAILWFFGWLVLSFLALRGRPTIGVQERYLYLPSIGFCLALALGLEWLFRNERFKTLAPTGVVAIVLVLLSTWSIVSIKQNRVWSDTLTVFRHTVELDPNSPHAHAGLAVQYALNRRIEEAEREANLALNLDSQCIEAHHALYFVARQKGELDQAITYLEKTITTVKETLRTRKDLSRSHLAVGSLYAQRREFDRAQNSLRVAAEMGIRAEAWYELGKLYFEIGRYEEALAYFELTSKDVSRTSAPIHFNLGQVYDRLGKRGLAQAEYKKYLELGASRKNKELAIRRVMELELEQQ